MNRALVMNGEWRQRSRSGLSMLAVVVVALSAPMLRMVAQQPARPATSEAASQAAAQGTPQGAPRFPHAKHEKLFPQCSGCHQGIPTGNRLTSFPDTALCGECHNNRDQKKTDWRAPAHTPSNLRYSHPDHMRQSGAAGATCTTCHASPDSKWMHVERATNAQCQGCHTHSGKAHLAPDNRCATCHVPLTQAKGISAARVAAFPKPPTHEQPNYAARHDFTGADVQQQCAVCHARETCARCHVNASRITTLYQLAPDARIAALVAGKAASYPVPATHSTAGFLDTHGALVKTNVQSCANCHARTSCQACHTGTGGASFISQLPLAEKGGAQGVQIKTNSAPWNGLTESSALSGRIALGPAKGAPQKVTGTEPRRAQVHPPGFSRTHGAAAASSQLNCEGCHARSYCADCHSGEGKRRFHVANFASRHAPEAWGRETNCQQCHNREVFCRGCHLQVALSAKGRTGVGYHSAMPLWTLQHGQAARQGLQSCTSCHTQKDCMQCHSQAGRRISPHGPDFDARRMWKANRLICLRCHFKDPLDSR